jgi:hypothetical protein
VVIGFRPHHATFVSVNSPETTVNNKIVLVALVTTLALVPAAPAQSCASAVYNSCSILYPGGDWLLTVLQGYCASVESLLCAAGI